MNITIPNKAFKLLAKVSRQTEVIRLFLLGSEAKRLPEIGPFEKIGAELNYSGELYKKDGDNFTAKVNATIKGVRKEEEDDPVVTISCEFLVYYQLMDNSVATDDEVEIFCKSNALYNVWPYFREHVSSMCQKMNIPQLVLPLLRLTPEKPRQKNDEEKIGKQRENVE